MPYIMVSTQIRLSVRYSLVNQTLFRKGAYLQAPAPRSRFWPSSRIANTWLECGPTICGDAWSDKALMDYLGAKLVTLPGNNFSEYRVHDPIRAVLNKLEQLGYQVVSMGGVGQTAIWTLYSASPRDPPTSAK